MNLPHAIKAGEFIVENSRQKHDLVCFDVFIAQRSGAADGTVFRHSVNHDKI
jgi:hypothetical protein